MLIGRDRSSLQTDLAVPLHLQTPYFLPPLSLSLSIPSSKKEGHSRDRQRGRGCRESGTEMGSGVGKLEKRKVREVECVAFSRAEKQGVRVSCERGEIAFSFHFTRLPLPVQPSPFTSRPLLRTFTQRHVRALVPSALVSPTCQQRPSQAALPWSLSSPF